MEIEYKFYLASKAEGEKIANDEMLRSCLRERSVIKMRSVYYDTSDSLLALKKAGLRLRTENGEPFAALKLSSAEKDGLSKREEYTCAASGITEGLVLLPAAGAPAGLCAQLLEKGVVPVADVFFDRSACRYEHEDLRFELCVDEGFFANGGRRLYFCELEIELLSGSFEKFDAVVSELRTRYRLVPEPFPKLVRALAFASE